MSNEKLTNLRLKLKRPGRIDGGEWHKPLWHCVFNDGQCDNAVPVVCGGERRPLGQDLIDAMQHYVDQGMVTEEELLEIRVVE